MAKVEYSNNNIFILKVKHIDGLTLLNNTKDTFCAKLLVIVPNSYN